MVSAVRSRSTVTTMGDVVDGLLSALVPATPTPGPGIGPEPLPEPLPPSPATGNASTAPRPAKPVDQRLRPFERFHSNRDFGRVMHRQQKAAGKWLVVLVAARGKQRVARCGISVSAKAVKTAVARHRCKRWVRECWRLHLKTILAGQDAVVVIRSAPPENQHAAFDAELKHLARKAMAATAAPGSRAPRRAGKPPTSSKPPSPSNPQSSSKPQASPKPQALTQAPTNGQTQQTTEGSGASYVGLPPAAAE
jgi:ribonuclease P protein component